MVVPALLKAGLNLANFSTVVPALTPLSESTTISFSLSFSSITLVFTGVISSLNHPFF